MEVITGLPMKRLKSMIQLSGRKVSGHMTMMLCLIPLSAWREIALKTGFGGLEEPTMSV